MQIIRGLTGEPLPLAASVLAAGNFDGVHRGHQAIIATARELAADGGLPVVALTFEPHPLLVLRPEHAPRRLGTPEQKLAALADAGADIVVVLDSTPQLLAIPADTFLHEKIVKCFAPRFIVEGVNFGFGRGREGNVDTLRAHEESGGYRTRVVEPVQQQLPSGETVRISSSLVRKLVAAGDVECAAKALGRPYALCGEVVKGAQRGQTLGFPTANVHPGDVLVPADGVYVGIAEIDDATYPAAISIGATPTFAGGERQVEAHLLDFADNLYGKNICLRFTNHLRDQRRFASRDELIAQITDDVAQVRKCTR